MARVSVLDGQSMIAPGFEALPLRTPTVPPATHTNAYLVGTGDLVLVDPGSPYADELDRAVEWVEAHLRDGKRLRAIALQTAVGGMAQPSRSAMIIAQKDARYRFP